MYVTPLFVRARLQLGIWRLFVQNVPIYTQSELHCFDFYSRRYLHGAVLCHHPPNYVQADIDLDQVKGE